MCKKNQTVLFGGSFNPPTIAHEEMIKYLSKHYKHVIVLPNGDDYHFKGKELSSFDNRIEMLSLITSKFNNVDISLYFKNNKFNGIVNTLSEFNHPYYVLGDDCLDNINEWIDVERLLNENKFIVFDRGSNNDALKKILNNPLLSKYKNHFKVLHNVKISFVSSSDYREHHNNEVLSDEIKKYILDHKLY